MSFASNSPVGLFWLGARALSRPLRTRCVDVVPNRAVAFVTGVLPPLVLGFEPKREARGPRSRQHDWIAGGDLVQQHVGIQPLEAFRDLHPLARREPVSCRRPSNADVGSGGSRLEVRR